MGTGSRSPVLLIDATASRSDDLYARLRERGLKTERVTLNGSDDPEVPPADVALLVLDADADADGLTQLESLLGRLRADNVTTLVWGSTPSESLASHDNIDLLAPEVTIDEVLGRLSMLTRYVPLVRKLDRELQHLQRLGRQLNRYFEEIDKEMRLAGRLQRDFMPRSLPELPPVRFASLYRPAAWVSGDIFDVFRIDENHMGMFIADAMGHGTAAGLMTMFLRKALAPKRIENGTYQIVRPAKAIRDLHDALAHQDLPNFQFITACYALLDTRTLDLCIARGGHPHPIHTTRSGKVREIQAGGGLLGIRDLDLSFEEQTVRLAPGDKIIFYTDGLEEIFIQGRGETPEHTQFTEECLRWCAGSAAAFIDALGRHLDRREGSLHPDDDVTAFVLEVCA